jgi:hypothetical protein
MRVASLRPSSLLANRRPPPREAWWVGAHAATQGAVGTAVAAGVTAKVQAYRAASAAAAIVTAHRHGRRLRYAGARPNGTGGTGTTQCKCGHSQPQG